jgi:tRNA A37 threonylcarbamoyladenosine dehydratase
MKESNLYDRQNLLDIKPPKKVAIIGCGGTGMNVGWLLAMVGTSIFYLFDTDVLEESNRARLLYTSEDVGKQKNKLLKDFIGRIRPNAQCVLFGEANDISLPLLLPYQPEYLFDCTDRRSTQRELVKWCKENKIKYARTGYNGEHFTTDDTISSFSTDLVDDEHGYTVIPSYAPTTILPALLMVDGICRMKRIPKLCTTVTELINAGEKL